MMDPMTEVIILLLQYIPNNVQWHAWEALQSGVYFNQITEKVKKEIEEGYFRIHEPEYAWHEEKTIVYIVRDVENYAGVYYDIDEAVEHIDKWLEEIEVKGNEFPVLLTEEDQNYVAGEQTWLYRKYIITKSVLEV